MGQIVLSSREEWTSWTTDFIAPLHVQILYSEMVFVTDPACWQLSLQQLQPTNESIPAGVLHLERKQTSLINVQMHYTTQLALENILLSRSTVFGSEIVILCFIRRVSSRSFNLRAIREELWFSVPTMMQPVLVKLNIRPQQGDSPARTVASGRVSDWFESALAPPDMMLSVCFLVVQISGVQEMVPFLYDTIY